MKRLTSRQITNYVIAWHLTDDPRIKRKLFEIIVKSQEGFMTNAYKTMRVIVGWDEYEDFKLFCVPYIQLAVEKFEYKRGTYFSTFAVWQIKHARNKFLELIHNVSLKSYHSISDRAIHKSKHFPLSTPVGNGKNTLGIC